MSPVNLLYNSLLKELEFFGLYGASTWPWRGVSGSREQEGHRMGDAKALDMTQKPALCM